MQRYKYWLHRLPHVADVTIHKLLKEYGNPQQVYDAVTNQEKGVIDIFNCSNRFKNRMTDVTEYTKDYDIDKEYENLIASNIKMVTLDEKEYPDRLKSIELPPYAIYYKGKLPENDIPSVAIIGARDCSEYGTFIANAFGESLAKENINVISGMARGIDGISQRGALKSDGCTFAVLGCGVDICYPPRNIGLYNDIQRKGGVMSPFPPGTEIKKRNFPERNRIVAGLADLVLVIEARQKSGTSITVDMALKQGKDIYAVPGRLTDRLSDGCNMLIRDGAGIALSPEDIIRELTVMWNRDKPNSEKLNQNYTKPISRYLPELDEGVLKYLDTIPKSVEEIHNTRLLKEPEVTLTQTMSELVLLAMEGKIVQVGSGYFSLLL